MRRSSSAIAAPRLASCPDGFVILVPGWVWIGHFRPIEDLGGWGKADGFLYGSYVLEAKGGKELVGQRANS